MSRILVVGASGTVGQTLVGTLQARGHAVVRATHRAQPAADQVHLDLVSGAGRELAFRGVEKAFLMAPPGHTNQHELLNPLIDAARAAGVRKIVLMTAMGANAVDVAPLRLAERHLEASGIAWNIIRPNWFMQNFNSYWLGGIRAQGAVLLPAGDARVSFIDARDIAAVAAALLESQAHDGQEFDLTGAESITHAEAARHLSEATGKTIDYRDIAPDVMRGHLLQAGLPADYAEFLLFILGLLKQGASERRTDVVERITGRAPIGFAQYARDYREAWM